MSNPRGTSAESGSSRLVELDAIRALAAINLVAFHFTHVYAVKYGYTSPLGFEFPWGKYGVQLFFMLSGVVNAMTLMKKQDAPGFLAARFIRICPAFWAVIGINVLIAGLAPLDSSGLTAAQVAANLTIVPNLLGYECIEPVTWTLQIEILFYGILMLLFVTRALENPLRAVSSLLILSATTCLCINYLTWTGVESRLLAGMQWYRDVMILEYLPLFTIGILLNELRCGRGSRISHGVGIAASVVVFHVIDRHNHNPAVTLLLLGLLTAATFGRAKFLRARPLVAVSTFSYALYLLHNNLGCVVIWHLNQAGVPPVLAMLIATVLVVAAAATISWKIERPVTRWLRQRWEKWRMAGPITQPASGPV